MMRVKCALLRKHSCGNVFARYNKISSRPGLVGAWRAGRHVTWHSAPACVRNVLVGVWSQLW